jgi:putative sporulation protein YyaC
MITLSNAPLYPGIGVNKKLPAIGDISITGIVNLSGKPGMSLLQSTRLYTVSNMARFISDAILSSSTH